jgi:hypothetical protein
MEYTGIHAKIRIAQFLPRRITPEAYWQRRMWSSAYQLSRLTRVLDVISSGIKYFRFHSE